MRTVTVDAPAKLNLFLETPSRRSDGFHQIETLMVPIDCFDTVTVSLGGSSRSTAKCCWVEDPNAITPPPQSPLPSDNQNLAFIAAQQLLAVLNQDLNFTVRIEKRIPAGAGMGGASSDAAAVLRCIAAICDFDDHETLHRVAASIGSDVPFFLQHPRGPISAAQASGRGEMICPVDLAKTLSVVVVHPGESLSTAAVYGENVVPDSPRSMEPILQAITSASGYHLIAPAMYNRLSIAATTLCPAIKSVLRELTVAMAMDEERLDSGANGVMMTGSGSACFALCNDWEHAGEIAGRIQSRLTNHCWAGRFRTVAAAQPVCDGKTC